PYILTLVPFVFPHLFAYFYTVLVPYDTAVASRFDPLIVALLVLFVEILLILWAKPYELRSEYQIFRSPRRHIATEKERRLEEEREWEAEVRADALSADDPADLPTEEEWENIDTPEEPQAAAEDESLYDREFVLSEEASAESAEKAPEEPTAHDGQSEEELRRSIASLFSDDDVPSQNKKKRK
ncbi:MAG: hypothetical protein J6B77_08880, partial [Clostridia bacterium]|nr:hypothetical protein [Clostridia bacterium]